MHWDQLTDPFSPKVSGFVSLVEKIVRFFFGFCFIQDFNNNDFCFQDSKLVRHVCPKDISYCHGMSYILSAHATMSNIPPLLKALCITVTGMYFKSLCKYHRNTCHLHLTYYFFFSLLLYTLSHHPRLYTKYLDPAFPHRNCFYLFSLLLIYKNFKLTLALNKNMNLLWKDWHSLKGTLKSWDNHSRVGDLKSIQPTKPCQSIWQL